MKHLTTYKLFESEYTFSEIELHVHDILQELQDDGLQFGTKSTPGDKKLLAVISNYNDIKVSNYDVLKYIKRLIDFLKEEGYTAYDLLINSNNMGAGFMDYELLDKYISLSPSEKNDNFRDLDIIFYKQSISDQYKPNPNRRDRLIVEAGKSYTKEDHSNLDELTKDVGNILLDLIDEYQLTSLTTDYHMHKTTNSYYIFNGTKATRHGVYGYVTVMIRCEDLWNDERKNIVNTILDDTMIRLDTIGHATLSIGSVHETSEIEIKIIPRN